MKKRMTVAVWVVVVTMGLAGLTFAEEMKHEEGGMMEHAGMKHEEGGMKHEEGGMMKEGMAGTKMGDFVVVCKAGKDCGRAETAAKDPKECKCGAEAEKMNVLKVEGELAILCQCGGGCACKLSEKNPYLCGCGTPIKAVRIVK